MSARAIPDAGGFNAGFTGSGTPKEIRFKDMRILSAGTGGTYCSGFTFSVVMDVGQNSPPTVLMSKSVDEIRSFQKNWYGTSPESQEKQCVVALAKLKVGQEVSHENAQPGDFVQFWRGTTGHSAVFLDWVTEGEKQVGLMYRSSQKTTNGVGDNIEYFSDNSGKKGAIDRKRTYFGRLNGPD